MNKKAIGISIYFTEKNDKAAEFPDSMTRDEIMNIFLNICQRVQCIDKSHTRVHYDKVKDESYISYTHRFMQICEEVIPVHKIEPTQLLPSFTEQPCAYLSFTIEYYTQEFLHCIIEWLIYLEENMFNFGKINSKVIWRDTTTRHTGNIHRLDNKGEEV